MSFPARRHIVLVGLPGCGKSTVGPLVAQALGAAFVDLDEAIERRSGATIPELFARYGEASFRVQERAEMDRLLAESPSVVAAGGGWAAQPGNLEGAERRALLVYLAVPAGVAAERAERAPGTRPLLSRRTASPSGTMEDDAPLARHQRPVAEAMAELLHVRAAFYERCEAQVDAAADPPAAVAAEVARLARSRAGW